MRILMVSPYPPARDGIASYAVQAVAALRASGHDVEVLSPGPSAAHHHLDLVGPRGALALAKRVRGYDLVVVQYHPDYFFPVPSGVRDRVAGSLALAAAFRAARRVEVRVHEVDYRTGRLTGPEGWSSRVLWHSVDRIVVHTAGERDDFVRAFGVSPVRVRTAPHGADFARRTALDRAAARRSLGIAQDAFVFLSLGFLQRHKGFDRAIRAFAGLGARGCRFDVVGSVRVEQPDYVAYARELEVLVAATAGTHLHPGFVSDELFDRWIVAADVVVLPYRSIWSSGVLERAALYDRPVIATAVGGLLEQAGGRAGVRLVADDAELRSAMWAAAGAAGSAPGAEPWPAPDHLPPAGFRRLVQEQVRLRAAVHRGSRVVPAASAGAGGSAGGAGSAASPGSASAPVRRVHPLALPPPTSHRTGAAAVKRAIRRLTAWEIEPVVGQVNALREAVVQALDQVAAAGPPDGRPAPRAAGTDPPAEPVSGPSPTAEVATPPEPGGT